MGRFQFSIRFLLAATAAVGGAVAALRAEPSWKAAIVCQSLAVLFATAAVIAAVITTRRIQVFWVGVAINLVMAGACSMHLITMSHIEQSTGGDYGYVSFLTLRIILLVVWCSAPLNGLFAVLLHWLFWRPRDVP